MLASKLSQVLSLNYSTDVLTAVPFLLRLSIQPLTQMSPYMGPNMACHSSSDNLSFVRVFQALILPQAVSFTHKNRIKE